MAEWRWLFFRDGHIINIYIYIYTYIIMLACNACMHTFAYYVCVRQQVVPILCVRLCTPVYGEVRQRSHRLGETNQPSKHSVAHFFLHADVSRFPGLNVLPWSGNPHISVILPISNTHTNENVFSEVRCVWGNFCPCDSFLGIEHIPLVCMRASWCHALVYRTL